MTTRTQVGLSAAGWLVLLAGCGSTSGDPEDDAETPPHTSERLSGGDTTNTLLLGANAFTRPAANIEESHEDDFYTGNSFFNQSWVTAPASTDARDGLGPLFNARSCSACHFKDGRGRPPLTDDEPLLGLLLRLSVPGETPEDAPLPVPNYGGQLQPFAINDVPAEASVVITWVEHSGEYDDGGSYTLLEPVYELRDPAYGDFPENVQISARVAPAVFGLGLLESISEKRLEKLADPDDADGDGISGRINFVPDAATGRRVVGRFGWKAEQPTVRQQSAGAFLGDMGITTSLFPAQDCTAAQVECQEAATGGDPEISDELLDKVAIYARLLAVPVREGWNDPEVLNGQRLFQEAGCAGCHVPEHETSSDAELAELRGQRVFPYTDLLLHDLGEELSDHRPSFDADGEEWRTAPLWGLGRNLEVNGHDRLLHDGRARGVAEAVLWHGGEAEPSKRAFVAMSKAERDDLVAFVESL